MADLSFLKTLDKPLAILGLGLSGQAVAEACVQAGIDFHTWDDGASRRDELALKYKIIDFCSDLSGYSLLVPAAGIKPSHPVLQKAVTQNIKIVSDIDLLLQSALDATTICITGTNGKSTTTALITHILSEAGVTCAMGGNIGRAACTLPSLQKGQFYVLELSSYQLQITEQPVADIAVYLNLSSDHLAWHGTMQNYAAAKERILRPRADKQVSIIGIDTAATAALAETYKDKPMHDVITVSTQRAADLCVEQGLLYYQGKQIADLNQHAYLRGVHNHENCAAATAACLAAGLSLDNIIKNLMSFKGLAHRQQKVTTWQRIDFINDSKATNADATKRALNSFDNIYWILGGQAKDDGIDGLNQFYPRVRHAFLIGEATDRFAKQLEGQLPYTLSLTLDRAVEQAFVMAKKQSQPSVILFSPSCASFDQYENFEKRGAHFEHLAQRIVAKEPS